jgi:hypothetical protein
MVCFRYKIVNALHVSDNKHHKNKMFSKHPDRQTLEVYRAPHSVSAGSPSHDIIAVQQLCAKLTASLYPVLRLRIRGATLPLLQTPSYRGTYLCTTPNLSFNNNDNNVSNRYTGLEMCATVKHIQ